MQHDDSGAQRICGSSPRLFSCITLLTRVRATLLALVATGSISVSCGGDDAAIKSGAPEQPGASVQPDASVQPAAPVHVMTRNLYLGTDLTPLLLLGSPDEIPDAVATLWSMAQATDFPSRAKVIADEIVTLAPDLVALQEVALYRRQVPSDFQPGDATPNATDEALDFLALLMAEIAARGGGYRVAGVSTNGDVELPASDGSGGIFDLRFTDHDVILARDSTQTSNFTATPFTNTLNVTVGGTGGVPVSFAHSSSHVDAVVGDAHLVFGNSHLEVELLPDTQLAQAQEVLDAFEQEKDPVLLAGDFNAKQGTDTYNLLASKFHDAYLDVAGGAPGYSCCQAGDLKNPESLADERIDIVWTRGNVRVNDVSLVGTDPSTGRTSGGLWASDHFGEYASVEVD